MPRRSLTQRLVTKAMPGRAEEIEAQSRAWILTCAACGAEQSFWDVGGVRYKASSAGKSVRVRCAGCGERTRHDVTHRPQSAGQAP